MILKILERGCKTLVGTFQKNTSFGFVLPDDRHYDKDIFISKKHINGTKDGDKVVVRLTDFGGERKKPEGAVIEILGAMDDPATDVTSIVRAYGIEEEFPKSVIKEAQAIPQEITEQPVGKRADFRDLLTVTIDGEDARDLDDAITLSKKEDKYYLGVHIADVSHYVKEDSPLDKEALERATSVYLADRVIPMLPKELSNGICSLNAGVERLAMSCMMTFDASGNVLDHTITESVICVDERMSYTGVKVVVSDIPANLEVGLPKDDYFHCGNVDELSEKLGKIIEAPLQHVDYDMSKYDWEKIANEVGEIYQGLKK